MGENRVQARKRIVNQLLASGWVVRTYFRSGHMPFPELRRADRTYGLAFNGRQCISIDGDPVVCDYRGWSLKRLLAFCDKRADREARIRLTIQESLKRMKQGERGIPHEKVMARLEAHLAAWWDPKRERPPRIPRFRSTKRESAFWARNDVLAYFREHDAFENRGRGKISGKT